MIFFCLFVCLHTLLDGASSLTCTVCLSLSWDEASSLQTGAGGGHGLGSHGATARAAAWHCAAAGTQGGAARAGWFWQGSPLHGTGCGGGNGHGVRTLPWAHHLVQALSRQLCPHAQSFASQIQIFFIGNHQSGAVRASFGLWGLGHVQPLLRSQGAIATNTSAGARPWPGRAQRTPALPSPCQPTAAPESQPHVPAAGDASWLVPGPPQLPAAGRGWLGWDCCPFQPLPCPGVSPVVGAQPRALLPAAAQTCS